MLPVPMSEESDYDTSQYEEKIIDSLSYMHLKNEYEIVLQLRKGNSISSIIPPPSLDLPVINRPMNEDKFNDDLFRTGNRLNDLYTFVNDPDIIVKIIKNLKCRPSLRECFAEKFKSEPDGLNSVITTLIQMNFKNYQPSTRDAIDKLIFMQHIGKERHSSTGTSNINTTELINFMHSIATLNYNIYYERFLDEEFFKIFISVLKKSINDKKIHLLIDSLNSYSWDKNIEIIRQSLRYGNEYIRMRRDKRIKQIISAKGADDIDTSIGKLKIIETFSKEYIPGNALTLKKLNSMVHNFFSPSNWRRRLVFHIRRAGTGIFNVNFVPCKDYSLILRNIAAGDNTDEQVFHLLNDATSFYKIYFIKDWIGYVTLLRVKTLTGYDSVLVEKININEVMTEAGFTTDVYFENMSEIFTAEFYQKNYRYLLIPEFTPEIPWMLSDNDSESIYYRYKYSPRLDGPLMLYSKFEDGYSIKPSSNFESMHCDRYIIVRDFTEHGQGVLPGCE